MDEEDGAETVCSCHVGFVVCEGGFLACWLKVPIEAADAAFGYGHFDVCSSNDCLTDEFSVWDDFVVLEGCG